ncbi:MAG: hypothetical protein ACPLSY_04890 [Moorellaceae bacterium]
MLVREEHIFALLMRLPGVFRVNAVRSQGSIKHFNVTYVFGKMRFDDGTLLALSKIWPFCNVQADPSNESIAIEFLVRPEEADSFRARVGSVLARLLDRVHREGGAEYTVLTAEFDASVPAECREEIRAILRSSDRIEWFRRSVVATLMHCRNAAAVGERITAVAAKYGLKVKVTILPPGAGYRGDPEAAVVSR